MRFGLPLPCQPAAHTAGMDDEGTVLWQKSNVRVSALCFLSQSSDLPVSERLHLAETRFDPLV